MSDTLLSLVGVGKSFKEVNALTHVDLEIKSGQVIGLVGGNGAGKTTLLRLMSGVMEPSKGTINFQDKPVSCLLYTSPSPRDYAASRMPSSA